MALDLNELRLGMAEYMAQHPRGSLDSAIFHAFKVAYAKGLEDGRDAGRCTNPCCTQVHGREEVGDEIEAAPEVWHKRRAVGEISGARTDTAPTRTAAIEELFHHGSKGV